MSEVRRVLTWRRSGALNPNISVKCSTGRVTANRNFQDGSKSVVKRNIIRFIMINPFKNEI